MKAGRELDALVDERVFGRETEARHTRECEAIKKRLAEKNHDPDVMQSEHLELVRYWDHDPNRKGLFGLHTTSRPYSTDISAAWEVVTSNKFGAQGYGFALDFEHFGAVWKCAFHWKEELGEFVEADTAPLAICLAALKALGHTLEE